MARSVNQIEGILFTIRMDIIHLDRMTLDGNAPLALQVHIVEGLGDQIAVGHGSRRLQQAVRQCTFTVIDMGDHTEIPNSLHGVQIYGKNRGH